jgi:hypothetical protein
METIPILFKQYNLNKGLDSPPLTLYTQFSWTSTTIVQVEVSVHCLQCFLGHLLVEIENSLINERENITKSDLNKLILGALIQRRILLFRNYLEKHFLDAHNIISCTCTVLHSADT